MAVAYVQLFSNLGICIDEISINAFFVDLYVKGTQYLSYWKIGSSSNAAVEFEAPSMAVARGST